MKTHLHTDPPTRYCCAKWFTDGVCRKGYCCFQLRLAQKLLKMLI